MPSNRQRGGRVHAHDRVTDDTTPIIGADLELPADHDDLVNETLTHDMDTKIICRCYYQSIKRTYDATNIRMKRF